MEYIATILGYLQSIFTSSELDYVCISSFVRPEILTYFCDLLPLHLENVFCQAIVIMVSVQTWWQIPLGIETFILRNDN